MTTREASTLASRVEAAVPELNLTTKRMFGGVTFLLDGKMLCCASSKGLMVRVGADAEPLALESPHASPCLGTGRPMPGFIMIEPAGLTKDSDLERWIALARTYVEKLPKKPENHRAPSPAKATSVRYRNLYNRRTKEKK